jgi:hypothetical protein
MLINTFSFLFVLFFAISTPLMQVCNLQEGFKHPERCGSQPGSARVQPGWHNCRFSGGQNRLPQPSARKQWGRGQGNRAGCHALGGDAGSKRRECGLVIFCPPTSLNWENEKLRQKSCWRGDKGNPTRTRLFYFQVLMSIILQCCIQRFK